MPKRKRRDRICNEDRSVPGSLAAWIDKVEASMIGELQDWLRNGESSSTPVRNLGLVVTAVIAKRKSKF